MSNNFAKLLEQKEEKEGRYISLTEVAEETEITRRTLYKWAKNEVTLYDPKVVDALCKYFNVEMADLIKHTPE